MVESSAQQHEHKKQTIQCENCKKEVASFSYKIHKARCSNMTRVGTKRNIFQFSKRFQDDVVEPEQQPRADQSQWQLPAQQSIQKKSVAWHVSLHNNNEEPDNGVLGQPPLQKKHSDTVENLEMRACAQCGDMLVVMFAGEHVCGEGPQSPEIRVDCPYDFCGAKVPISQFDQHCECHQQNEQIAYKPDDALDDFADE